MAETEVILKPRCPYCSAAWTDEMVRVEAGASAGCPTCGDGTVVTGSVEIHCGECKRLIYKKEF